MILEVFALLDSKAQIWSHPFFFASAVYARRVCEQIVQDRDTNVGRHPADFSLYRIGWYDDATGRVSHDASFEFLFQLSSLVKE